MSGQDAQVWRVCSYFHAVDSKFTGRKHHCKGCGPVTFSYGRPVQTRCYMLALQLLNTVITGDPQKRAEDDHSAGN